MENDRDKIEALLDEVRHPESGKGIVASDMVESIDIREGKVSVIVAFTRARDPFAPALRRRIKEVLERAMPDRSINVIIKEQAPKPAGEKQSAADGIDKIVAVASGKGGVGKSTVAANMALALGKMGYRTGLLDADIYGPSQAKMFGLDSYEPEVERQNGLDLIVPAERFGIKIMSIAFFIAESDALIWRGAMATSALKQLIHQTKWGELDFLVVDLPPGTGDVHLTVIQEIRPSGAVIVSTPQGIALADVLRGIRMFETEKIEVPVLGIIENMSWFSPEDAPDKRYYIFGHGGASALAKQLNITLLGEIPILESVMQSGEIGTPAVEQSEKMLTVYRQICEKIVKRLKIGC